MKIYKYNVPKELIEKYCKIIMQLEKQYSSHLERARSEIHNEIFNCVGCSRALDKRDDREFNKALNEIVIDLTYTE